MTRVNYWLTNILRWFDSEAGSDHLDTSSRTFNWVRVLPFIALHLACLLVLVTGTSTFAMVFALGFFLVRMFAITGFYHRYFSHKSFKTIENALTVCIIYSNSKLCVNGLHTLE